MTFHSSPQRTNASNRMAAQRGGTLLGIILGVMVGLAAALAVAIYVAKVPVPFVNKNMSRTSGQDAAEAEKNRDWDPNAPLRNRNAAQPSTPTRVDSGVVDSVPPPAEVKRPDKTNDKVAEKPVDKAPQKAADKAADEESIKPASKPAIKPADKAADKPAAKPADKTAEKAQEKATDKAVEKTADKTDPEPKAATKPSAAAASKPTAAERPVAVQVTRPASADPLGDLARARSGESASGAADPFTYFVQAGAFRSQEDAESQRARLSLLGVEARVTEREQAGRTVYRVRVGPFQNKDAADRTKERLDGNGFESALVRVQR